ncbi:hypothetical protein BX600DRAFT_320747 [Xylariales sp. PMI_506]|nr:hypothetical protein BX600DRAFT_320747 [Xylariales sp. PMI_506]
MSSAASFLSRPEPPELIVRILKSCASGADVLPLTAAGQHFRPVWLGYVPAIIWHIRPQEIVRFGEVLT